MPLVAVPLSSVWGVSPAELWHGRIASTLSCFVFIYFELRSHVSLPKGLGPIVFNFQLAQSRQTHSVGAV